jgi:actin-related protein
MNIITLYFLTLELGFIPFGKMVIIMIYAVILNQHIDVILEIIQEQEEHIEDGDVIEIDIIHIPEIEVAVCQNIEHKIDNVSEMFIKIDISLLNIYNINDNIKMEPIIIDNGSDTIKAGFSGFLHPNIICHSIIGKTKYKKIGIVNTEPYIYIGKEADSKRSILDICNPIKNGIVDNWDNMVLLWEYIFKELNTEPTNKKILLTEPVLNPIKNKEKTVEIMFEYFNVSSTFIGIQGILSLYGNGKTTGVVLDIGHDISHITPVYEGYSIKHSINRINLAGNDITEYLKRLLELSGYRFSGNTGKDIVRKIKERYAYCSVDDKTPNSNFEYKLPDGNKINITSESYESPEILFNPKIIGKDIDGLHTMLYKSVIQTDINIRRPLFSNIILSGGTSLLNNFDNRLSSELNKLVNIDIDIESTENRQYTTWLGGSILSGLPTFDSSWITKQEYNEYGNSIIYRKSM